MKKLNLKKISLVIAGILCGLVVISFFIRNIIFSFYLEHRIDGFNSNHGAILNVGKARMHGISDVLMTGITLKPLNGDTLLTADTADLSLNFWKMIFGKIDLRGLKINRTRIRMVQADSLTNYGFLLHRNTRRSNADSLEKINYSDAFSDIFSTVFNKVPSAIRISDLTVSYKKDGHEVSFHVVGFLTDHHAFHTPVEVSEGDTVKEWIFAGSYDNELHNAGFRMYSPVKEKIRIPYIGYSYKALLGFDTLTFRISEEDKGDDNFHLRGMFIFNGLEFQQEKLALKKITFDRLGLEYVANVGTDYFELDSASQVYFNRLSFHPYIRYRPKPSKQISFSIVKNGFPAEELFSSLPEGLFSTLKGIKMEGDLSFNLGFFVDLSLPDSLQFNVDLKRNRFRVVSYGDAGLTRLNESFAYTAYEHGVPERTFIVGPENPDFRPLNKISPYLQVSILNSEDPGFYQHRGFIPEAFRESIIQNIKERRFARGGSTITMQLVKNVFLNRNKTIARKLEEILLVWLIENHQLCSKERMFEVYLNIIELGPHVYGVREAAHFYFGKEPAKLTLAESIFLASIIPKPKWFMYSFDENGHLKQSEKDFFRLLSGKMLNKGQISQEEYDNLIPDVTLKGPAKLLLKTNDQPPPAKDPGSQDDEY